METLELLLLFNMKKNTNLSNELNKLEKKYQKNTLPTDEKFESNKTKYTSEFEKLEKKYNGQLNPKDVVREASNPKSPLHNWFDWDDNEASEKWRLHQARMLITTIKVNVVFNGNAKSYRKYLNVNVGDEKGRFYVPTTIAIKNPDMKSQILQKAVNEIIYWEKCYSDYKELEDVFLGIRKTKKRLKKMKILVPNTA